MIVLCEICRKPTGMEKWPHSHMKGICEECVKKFEDDPLVKKLAEYLRELYTKKGSDSQTRGRGEAMSDPKVGEWWIHSRDTKPFLVLEFLPDVDWGHIGSFGCRYDWPSEYLTKFVGTPPDLFEWALHRVDLQQLERVALLAHYHSVLGELATERLHLQGEREEFEVMEARWLARAKKDEAELVIRTAERDVYNSCKLDPLNKDCGPCGVCRYCLKAEQDQLRGDMKIIQALCVSEKMPTKEELSLVLEGIEEISLCAIGRGRE